MCHPVQMQIRVLQAENLKELKQLLSEIKVDPYGVKIMAPKAAARLVRINSLSNITANILKQEMLSLGGDAAVSRDALTGKAKTTDCALIGNLAQFSRLAVKLNRQPFGLNRLGKEISRNLQLYQQEGFSVPLPRAVLNLRNHVNIMGVINLTPDSFSGDGWLARPDTADPAGELIEHARGLIRSGADILDLGGESSRPGARPVSAKEELRRLLPALKTLVRSHKIPISIDTYKPEVANVCLDNGAQIINDISGLRDPRMAKTVARYKAAVVIMHMRGRPRTMQRNPEYTDLMGEIIAYLDQAVASALASGIEREKIIIDPGLGFGKTMEHNLAILRNLSELKILGRPILVGPSRKSFLGKILDKPADGRLFGTISSCVLAARNGCHIVRVHDVKPVKEALKVFDAVTLS